MSEMKQETWVENPGNMAENQTIWAENSGNTAADQTMRAEYSGDAAANQTANAAAMAATVRIAEPVKQQKKESEETKRFKENFGFFGPAAFLYAVFYAFCMYRNGSGVTFPFFVGGGLLFLYFSLSRLGTTLKRGSAFYMAAIVLLGISTFCTDDSRIIFFNKLGILLLMMSLLLKQFFDTEKWKLGKYLCSICQLICMSFGELGRPFSDGKEYYKRQAGKINRKGLYIILGLVIAIPLFLMVLLLLASADAVFRQMTDRLFASINFGSIMNILFRIAFLFFASYALISYLCRKSIKEEVKDRRNGEPILAITVTSLLTLLYLFFSGIQIAALFLGKLQLPEGYTYAMYAREGFFQLLAVSVLNLVIVLICLGFFKESKVLKTVLTVMSLCTFVMIASSAMRMVIYIMYYYLTFLRVLVLWALALLAVLFVGVIVNIFKEEFHLFRYSMAVVTVFYLGLSFAHPDYIIARVNVSNTAEAGVRDPGVFEIFDPYQDYDYLSNLSADAAPVLVPYLEKLGYDMEAFEAEYPVRYAKDHKDTWYSTYNIETFGYYWMWDMKGRTENFGVRTFNVSRFIMLRLLENAAN